MSAPARAVGWRDHLVGLLLGAAYVAVLLGTVDDLAMSRDEGFYVIAAEHYGRWFERLWEDPSAALERKFIDRSWDYNHEHPSLIKSLFALSWIAHQKLDFFEAPGTAIRFPGMVSAGLLLWLIYIWGARARGRVVGLAGAVAYALLPRPFYHAHLACFDVPIVLMVVLVAYCYWRSLSSRIWLLWLGVAYGLALATKHNAWILPGVFLIHWGWTLWGEMRARRQGAGKRVRAVPWWLLSMALLGPPIFVGLWPWLWHETWDRFAWYANFHLNHVHYNYAYFGVNYWQPPMPIGVPWVLTLFTVPLTTLVLALVGVGLRARTLLPPGLDARLWPNGRVTADLRQTDVLWLGLLLAPLVLISLPSTPIFGGTKHWFPAYPFLALFAGVAVGRLLEVLRETVGPSRWKRAAASVAAVALLAAPAAAETAHSHPFGLAHYTVPAGGVPGAADKGMNRQFWGYTHGPLAGWLESQLPEGGTVWPCDATAKAWNMMRRDGMIRNDIRVTGNLVKADFAIVHHEMHFVEVDYQIWAAYGSVQPAYVLTHDGVPIVSVYENPRRRRR